MIRTAIIALILLGLAVIVVGLYCAVILASQLDDEMERREDRYHDCD